MREIVEQSCHQKEEKKQFVSLLITNLLTKMSKKEYAKMEEKYISSFIRTEIPPGIDATLFSPAPLRVFPGRLSVSRTIGDIEAKSPSFDGIPNIIIPTPEVSYFKINNTHDFILLGCDGIYDRLENEEIINLGWSGILDSNDLDEHSSCGRAIELILKGSICKRTLDNVTLIMIAFNSFLEKEKELQHSEIRNLTVEAIKRNSSVDNGVKVNMPSTKYRNIEFTPKAGRNLVQSISNNLINLKESKKPLMNNKYLGKTSEKNYRYSKDNKYVIG